MTSFQGDLKKLRANYDSVTEDIYPAELRDYARDALGNANQVPALLCLLSFRNSQNSQESPDIDEVTGIQFIHTGLCVTREVLNDPESWEDVDVEPVEEDMMLLGADVLVTLGFDFLISHYKKASRIVNEFGSGKAYVVEGNGDVEKLLKHEASEYVEAYRTA
ncbi:MAG: hypothetical protein SXQ77_07335, partial [Halobacteria archaeon]|nr:hypothetical protein [Halobacteria archaeon]